MAATRSADPSLVEALLSDAALLSDPTQTGSLLLDAFQASAQRGVSATFFASVDGSGSALETSTAPSATTDGKPGGANSAHFAGFFEVLQAGPYRFSAVCGKAGAVVSLRLDGEPDPVLTGTASADGAAISGVIALKPGNLYGFTLEVGSLSGGDVSLLVQGETMPQDALSQLTLYPRDAVERVRRADVLLAKALQLILGLALDEREVRYLLTHGADFDGLSFSRLPSAAADGTPSQAAALFTAFLRLAGYVALRADVAGGTDDLIDIFENARRIFPDSLAADQVGAALLADLTQRFAALTRRDPSVVQAAAIQLGFAPQATTVDGVLHGEVPEFSNELELGRLWQSLQVVETLGISVASTAASDASLPSVARKILSNRWSASMTVPLHRIRSHARVKRPGLGRSVGPGFCAPAGVELMRP